MPQRQLLFSEGESSGIVFGGEVVTIILRRTYSQIGAHIERGGEYKSAVVVGMVADEVHAPWGEKVPFSFLHSRKFSRGKGTFF
jgi:hypothetical protein